jgi:hypothetical protein
MRIHVIPTPFDGLRGSYARNERSGGISPVVSPAEIPRLRSQAHTVYPELAEGLGMTGGGPRQARVIWGRTGAEDEQRDDDRA